MSQYEEDIAEVTLLQKFCKKNALVLFFVLSYALMTIAVVLKVLLGFYFPEILFWIISVWSPTISAFFLSGLIGGWRQVKSWLKGFTRWRVGIQWYFAAFFIMLGPLLIALVYNLIGGQSPGITPGLTLPILLFNLGFSFLSGPVSEEPGWRGFALPRLQARFGALTSSIILGFVWAFWHLPLYFVEPRLPLYIFVPLVLVITILMTWVYNNSKGSLILTIIMHFSFNFDMAFLVGYLGLLPQMVFYISASIAIGIYVIAVVWYAGPKKLSRKPESEIPRIP
jgi:membrane protease YdiL (CAAX protease family)